MSGFPVAGEKGTIACSTASSDLLQLFTNAIKPAEFEISDDTDMLDSTGLGTAVVAKEFTPGLCKGSTRFTAYYPQTTPKIGNLSLVATGSIGAETALVRATKFTLRVSCPALDITAFNGTPPTWKVHRPSDLYEWSGEYTQLQESGTAGPTIAAAGDAAVGYVFSLIVDSTHSNKFSGSVHRAALAARVARGSLIENRVTFKGTGSLTQTLAGTAANAPGLLSSSTGAVGTPSWDLTTGDGIPDVSVVHTLYTGRTITVPAFWTDLEFMAEVGQLLKVTGTLQWAGTPAFA